MAATGSYAICSDSSERQCYGFLSVRQTRWWAAVKRRSATCPSVDCKWSAFTSAVHFASNFVRRARRRRCYGRWQAAIACGWWTCLLFRSLIAPPTTLCAAQFTRAAQRRVVLTHPTERPFHIIPVNRYRRLLFTATYVFATQRTFF